MLETRTQNRITRAIRFIEENLEGKLALPEIAAQASMSSWYFSRLFPMVTGVTVADYTRRRKLTEAAKRLLATEDAIIDIAVAFSFGSQQAFTRAFTREFKLSPGALRRQGHLPDQLQEELYVTITTEKPAFIESKPVIKSITELQLCGPAEIFDMQSRVAGIPALWGRFVPLMEQIPDRIGTATYGACISAGEHGEAFRYQAAVQVAAGSKGLDGCELSQVPGGEYAVFTHVGKATDIAASMEYIWSVWLPGNGKWQHRMAPDFEYYDDRFNPMTGEGVMEISVPVQPEM